jgi:hypothetical protein
MRRNVVKRFLFGIGSLALILAVAQQVAPAGSWTGMPSETIVISPFGSVGNRSAYGTTLKWMQLHAHLAWAGPFSYIVSAVDPESHREHPMWRVTLTSWNTAHAVGIPVDVDGEMGYSFDRTFTRL